MRQHHGPRTGRPPTRATRGMITTSHYLASAAGLQVLREGGSAVDAAIAANAVLCVAYPHMAGLGGDGFWLIHAEDGGGVQALNASGPAARAATRDYYRERGQTDAIPTRGALSALTVPGAVDGWWEAHARFGKLPWERLFDDAIHYAASGVAVARSLADWIAEDEPVFSQHHSSARIFTPGGKRKREGDRLVQEELARSLERIAHEGGRAFYEGEIAERICRALEPEGCPLRPEDFRDFKAEWVEPLSVSYRGFDAFEFPPNTQGFAALQILKLLEAYDVAAWGDGTAAYYHHMAEAVKLAFADRDAWLTDSVFVDIPVDELLSDSYLKQRRTRIRAEQAMEMSDVPPGIPFEERARRKGRKEEGAPSSGRRERRSAAGDTCYLAAVDGSGLAVSLIQSIYHDFGSAEIAGDTGILLQNRGSFFSLDEGHPNRLEPGKRTFHTLIPAMLMKEGRPWLVHGTMGGEGQPQTHAALVTRLVDFGYDVQQAIEAPRWLMGRTWGTESRDLSLEGRIPDEVVRDLELRGQPVKMLRDWDDNMGHAQAIRLDAETGMMSGGADPRGDGAALGF